VGQRKNTVKAGRKAQVRQQYGSTKREGRMEEVGKEERARLQEGGGAFPNK
jgi:hypothetical protein